MIKKCRVCHAAFAPANTLQRVCSPACGLAYAKASREKAERKRARQKLAADREKLKTVTDYRKEAQTAFNRYIQVRDSGLPCISCGITSGQMHAGHYRTRAAAPQLAFNTANVHRQCAQCNNSKSGNVVEYRKGLIRRVGAAAVERIEYDNSSAEHTIDYLKRIKAIFAKRARHTTNLRERARIRYLASVKGF